MFSKLKILPILIILLFMWSCGGKEEEKIILLETNLENQMIAAYKKGMEELEKGDALYAAKNFKIAENIYPQSAWAPKTIIMSAYAYYSQDYYADVIFELERYLKLYPNGEYKAYAYYLIGLSYYESIVDEKKDTNPILKSKEYFDYLKSNYPNSDFALDANYKILLIENLLASKELYIAKYYLERDKWIPAINRLKTILEIYDEGNDKLILLHCISDYPAKIEESNLNAINEMKKEFNLPVGFSDHTKGTLCSLSSAIMGANIVEKHMKHPDNSSSPDDIHALAPNEFSQLVKSIRLIESAKGSGEKIPSSSELKNLQKNRVSIIVMKEIEKGTKIEPEMIDIRRPGNGISPFYYDQILSKTAKLNISKETPLTWDMIE